MSAPRLRVVEPEIQEGSPVKNKRSGTGIQDVPSSSFRGSSDAFGFTKERVSSDLNVVNGMGNSSGMLLLLLSPIIGGAVSGGRSLAHTKESDKQKMVEQFYMGKPQRNSRYGLESLGSDSDMAYELLDPFSGGEDAKEDETTTNRHGMSLGLGLGVGSRLGMGEKTTKMPSLGSGVGTGSGTASSGGIGGVDSAGSGVTPGLQIPGNNVSSNASISTNGTNSGNGNGSISGNGSGGGGISEQSVLGKLRNGNITYNLFATNDLRNEELISCLLNLDNIVMEEVAKKNIGGDAESAVPDSLTSFTAASQILETVVMDLHGTRVFKSNVSNQFETFEQMERYIHRLNVNLEQLEQLMLQSRNDVSTKFKRELSISFKKLNELKDLLVSLEQKLAAARDEVNEQKDLLFHDLSERLEVLEYIGNRFKEQAKITREWRVRQMYISLATLVLVLAIGVYYIQLRKLA